MAVDKMFLLVYYSINDLIICFKKANVDRIDLSEIYEVQSSTKIQTYFIICHATMCLRKK